MGFEPLDKQRAKEITIIINNYKNLIVDCLEVVNDPNNSDVKQFLINKGEIADDSATSQTPETPDAGQDSRAEAQKILGEAYPSYSAPGETSDRKMGEKGGGTYMDYYKKFPPMNSVPDIDPAGGAKLTPEQLAPMNVSGPESLNLEKLRALGLQNEELLNKGKYPTQPSGSSQSSYNPGKNFINNLTFGLGPK